MATVEKSVTGAGVRNRWPTRSPSASSGWSSSVAGVGAVLLLVLLASDCAAQSAAPRSAGLEFVPVREEFLGAAGSATPLDPGTGHILVLGSFDHPDFAIENVSQITVTGPDGRQLPLTIESQSTFLEFDRIVALRFCFVIDEAAASSPKGDFKVSWGPDVRAENVKVDRFPLDASLAARYREFRWARADRDGAGRTTSVASVEVIADSSAQYHFLWYLLPIAVVFVLLTIRKIRARHATNHPAL